MHLSALNHIGGPPVLRLIPRTVGTLGGDMTGGTGGMAAARDGVYSNYWYAGAIHLGGGVAHIGVLWPAPRAVARVALWSPSNGWAAASQYGVARIEVQGSHDTTSILDGAWTTLYTVERPSNVTDSLDTMLALAPYRAHRIRLTQTAYDGVSTGQLNLGVAELEFYEYSYI